MVVIPHAKDIKITTLNFGKKCIGSTHNFFTTEILLMLGGRTKRIIKNIQNKKTMLFVVLSFNARVRKLMKNKGCPC